MAEEIIPIVGAQGYFISNYGRVFSSVRGGIRELKTYLKNGYPFVDMKKVGQRDYIHRLVAKHFVGPQPSPKHEVAHNDGVKINCKSDNLRWATREENLSDKIAHGTDTRGEKSYNSILSKNDVAWIRTSSWRVTDIASHFGVHQSHISKIRTGKARKFG